MKLNIRLETVKWALNRNINQKVLFLRLLIILNRNNFHWYLRFSVNDWASHKCLFFKSSFLELINNSKSFIVSFWLLYFFFLKIIHNYGKGNNRAVVWWIWRMWYIVKNFTCQQCLKLYVVLRYLAVIFRRAVWAMLVVFSQVFHIWYQFHDNRSPLLWFCLVVRWNNESLLWHSTMW